jgi:3-methyladenine DNA glycosylase AlkC
MCVADEPKIFTAEQLKMWSNSSNKDMSLLAKECLRLRLDNHILRQKCIKIEDN